MLGEDDSFLEVHVMLNFRISFELIDNKYFYGVVLWLEKGLLPSGSSQPSALRMAGC
jgi:hypothetical protein